MFDGKVEKFKKNKLAYNISYWSNGETYDDAVEYQLSKFALAADLLLDDLTIV